MPCQWQAASRFSKVIGIKGLKLNGSKALHRCIIGDTEENVRFGGGDVAEQKGCPETATKTTMRMMYLDFIDQPFITCFARGKVA